MYIAIDGDSVGMKLQQYILEEKLEELSLFSESIKDTLSRETLINSSYFL